MEVKEWLGNGGRPAIQTRGSGTNPFGPTFVYGYRDIAFEVGLLRPLAYPEGGAREEAYFAVFRNWLACR